MGDAVTMRDIAEQAGTSVSAVSYAFNGHAGLVNPQKREHILAVARKLGYRPNRQARQLRRQANMAISVQIDSGAVAGKARQTMALYMLLLQGVSSGATAHGYHLHMLMPRAGQDDQEFQEQILRENAVDGVVFMGYTEKTLSESRLRALIKQMRALRLPGVTLNHRVAAHGVPAVLTSLEPAIRQMVGRVSELGHRRAGYIGVFHMSGHEQEGRSRYEMFCDALADAGVELAPDCVREAGLEVDAYRETLALLDAGQCPSCLIYSGDHLAMAGMKALTDRGLQVGRDVSVLGVDHAPYSLELPLGLATIDQRFIDRGQLMAKLLIDQIQRPDAPAPKHNVVEAFFVDGSSLGAAS